MPPFRLLHTIEKLTGRAANFHATEINRLRQRTTERLIFARWIPHASQKSGVIQQKFCSQIDGLIIRFSLRLIFFLVKRITRKRFYDIHFGVFCYQVGILQNREKKYLLISVLWSTPSVVMDGIRISPNSILLLLLLPDLPLN